MGPKAAEKYFCKQLNRVLFMLRFLSLTFNPARDIVRQPVIAVLTVACIVTIGILPVIAVFSLGQEERIVRDGAMASCFVFGLLLVIASSVASIFKQVRSGTAGSVLCKPVSRELFFGATYCGILLACLSFVGTAVLAALLSVRMALRGMFTDWLVGIIFAAAVLAAFIFAGLANYRGRNFCSALFKALFLCLLPALLISAFFEPGGQLVRFGSLIRWELLPVALLLFAALAMLAAIAVTLSSRCAPIVVFSFCCLIFVLGLISNYLFSAMAGPLAKFCAAILPDWQCLWVYGDLDGSNAVTAGYLLKACAYAGLYIAGVLCLGVLSFKNSDA